MIELPLFPLKTVLLPGNKLSLKIFEPRYVDMIAQCLREDSHFGVILIYKGDEVSTDSEFYSIGTTAKIDDWQDRSDGLLGITALGIDRFEVIDSHNRNDGLVLANVEILSEPEFTEIPEQFFYMRELLEHILTQEAKIKIETGDFTSIMYRLIYLLPLETELKQRLLEVPDSHDRASILHAELIRLGVIQYVKPGSNPG
ncbi:MAG: LON peptidase substrate-binding domain-containing protein [Gammaproteobacteria bacterium]|nr:LON peptidase substrate-binding domain-containing protein [Gammaproteobacteria bacterium]